MVITLFCYLFYCSCCSRLLQIVILLMLFSVILSYTFFITILYYLILSYTILYYILIYVCRSSLYYRNIEIYIFILYYTTLLINKYITKINVFNILTSMKLNMLELNITVQNRNSKYISVLINVNNIYLFYCTCTLLSYFILIFLYLNMVNNT